jgi:tetratricopeptide (TPR) repeat protein
MNSKASILKLAALAVAVGVITWLLVPYLLPVKLPPDFPRLPDTKALNPGLRSLLENADREARRQPGSSEAMGKLGMAYHSNQFFDEGARAYRVAARLAPSDYQWAYAQALLNEESGNEREQLRFLKETVRLKPDYGPALVKLGDSYFKQDKLDEAARYYETAAKLPDSSSSFPATFGLGRVAARRQEWGKVVEQVAPLTVSYSYVLPPYELLQEAYQALGQKQKAMEANQNAALAKWKLMPVADDPVNEQVMAVSFSSTRLLKQAGVLSRLGHPDRAVEVARRAERADPTDPAIPNFIAYTLLTFFGDQPAAIDEALTQLGTSLRLKPDDLSPLWNFTGDFFKTPKPLEAVERLATILRPHANLPEAQFYLGLVADAQGKTEDAVSYYQTALKRNPNDSAVYNKLGLISDRAMKFDQAIAQFERSVELNPANTGARFNLGIALMQSGKYNQAVKEFGELLRRNPHDANTHFSMGFALLYSKRPDEAIARFRDGLRYQSDDPDAHYGIASALLAQHKPEQALPEVQEALKLRPNFPAAQELLQQMGH